MVRLIYGVGAIVKLIIGIAMVITAIGMIRSALADRRDAASLARAPLVPVSSLDRYVGQWVRVQTHAPGDGSYRTHSGQPIAFERFIVEHKSGGKQVSDFDHVAPYHLPIGDTAPAARVCMDRADLSVLSDPVTAQITQDGKLPDSVLALRPDGKFGAAPLRPNTTVRVYTLSPGDALTVIGIVRRDHDAILLDSGSAAQPLVVSRLSLPAIQDRWRRDTGEELFFGWFILLTFAVATVALLAQGRFRYAGGLRASRGRAL